MERDPVTVKPGRMSHKEYAYRERGPGEPSRPVQPMRPQWVSRSWLGAETIPSCDECWEPVPRPTGMFEWMRRRNWRRVVSKHREQWGHDPVVERLP